MGSDSEESGAEYSSFANSPQLAPRGHVVLNYELLKEDTLKKDALIHKLQREHLLVVGALNSRITELEQQNLAIQLKADTELKEREHYFRQVQEQTRQEIDGLKKKLHEVELQNPIIRDKIAQIKADLADLTLSETAFVELKARPAEQLSIKEFLLLRVYEITQQFRQQRDAFAQEARDMSVQLGELKIHTVRAQREYENLLHIADERQQELSESLNLEQIRSGKLQRQISDIIASMESLEAKGRMYDQMNEALRKAEDQVEQLQDKLINTTHSARLATETTNDQGHKLAETTQALELLKMDKVYLSKEVESLQLQVRRYEQQHTRQQQKMRELKASREDALQRLVKLKEEQKTNYEERLTAEVERLRVHTSADLEAIRISSKEALERDSRSLREARDTAIAELDRTLVKLNESRAAYEELQLEHRMAVSGFESKIAEINNQLKLKLFELERTALSYEEVTSNLAQARVEIEKNHKKIDVLTSEYYTLQTRSEKQIAELSSRLQDYNDKIILYENGDPTFINLKRNSEQLDSGKKEVMKMLEAEKEKTSQLTQQLVKSGELLHYTTQPSNYLIDLITQRDVQLDKCNRLIEHLDKELAAQYTAFNELAKKKEALEAQCCQMLDQESKVLTLKRIIEKIQQKVAANPAAFHITEANELGKRVLEINSAPLWYQKLRTPLK